RRYHVQPQAGRPGRSALHGGLAVGPVLPGPARPGLPEVEHRRPGRVAEPAGHPRARRAEPRVDRVRRPDRGGPGHRIGGVAAVAGTDRGGVRTDPGVIVYCGHVVVGTSRVPGVRDARRGRAGTEGTGGRVLCTRPADVPGHHAGDGGAGAAGRIRSRAGGVMPTPRTARRLRHRVGALVATIFVVAAGTLFWPSTPASAG